MKDKLEITITSIDGKTYHDFVDALYIDIPTSGRMGILPNRIPFVSMLSTSVIYFLKGYEKYYFALTEGVINYRDSKAIILCDTFEAAGELDKARVISKKEKAEETLSKLETTDDVMHDDASFSLKKALNRLKLIK